MPLFNQGDFNSGDFNGPPVDLFIPPAPPVAMISTPLAPPPQQLTNYATLINGQADVAGVLLFKNGVLQTEGLDYARSRGVLTMLVPPISTDLLVAQVFAIGRALGGPNPRRYISPWAIRITGKYDGIATFYEIAFGPTITGGCDGINSIFGWGIQVARAKVFKNGILQTLNQDVVTGPWNAIFLPRSIPQPGDIITVLAYSS